MNSTNDLETPSEHELARRLQELAETTTVSPDAWDRIAARTVASVSSPASRRSRSAGFARRHARPLLATAAAVAVLIGLAVAFGAGGDDNGLRTTDHGESTTTTERRPSSERRSSSTTTTESSTTLPGGEGRSSDSGSAGGTTPSTETNGAGDGTGQPGGETASGPGGPESGESERAAPTRATPTMTLRSSEYTVEIIADPEPGLYFRRTDDVGNNVAGPDGYGADSHSGWSSQSGPRCLTSSGGTVTYPDAGPHAFTYGLAGSEIARVEVVMPDGATVPASIGPSVGGGFRAWLVERPAGNTVQEIRGLDAGGNVVASIGQRVSDDFGYSTATC
jgi:hypothetical protein